MESEISANCIRTVKERLLYNYKDYLPHALLSLFGLLSMIGFFMVGGNRTDQCVTCSHSSALRALLNETSQDDKYYQFLRHFSPHEKNKVTLPCSITNSITSRSFTQLIESSNPQQRVQDSSGASHESFKYTIITVVLCQWIAIGWFTYHMSCKLNQTYQDMYDQLSLLSDVQKFLDGETQGISDALDEVEGDLRNELRNLNDSQKTELDKASLSIASIWSEIYKIRQEFKVNSFIGFNPTMAANPPSPVLGVPTPPAPTNPPAAPVPMYDFYSTKKFATNNNRSNILKTGYGAFDLSTKEGREKWIRSMKAAQSNHNSNNPANNNKTNNASKPTQLFMTKAETKQQPQDKRYAARTENSGSASPQTKPDNKLPVIPLTSNELKQKLEEGEKKQYRRLFIPGRGWMSAKRLQEESQLLEKAETEAAAASAYAVTSPTSAEPTNAATTESSNVVSTFPDDPATATKISQQ